jgi:hypothetical protein
MATHDCSKRATIGEGLLKFWALILLALILVIFIFLFQFNKPSTATIQSFESNTIADIILLNYLKTPITVKSENSDEQSTVGQLIIEYYHTPSMKREELKNILFPHSKKIFDVYPNIWWKIIISERPKDGIAGSLFISDESKKKEGQSFLIPTIGRSCTMLPTFRGENAPKIELVLFNNGAPNNEDLKRAYAQASLPTQQFTC